jgi:hypothetical protein
MIFVDGSGCAWSYDYESSKDSDCETRAENKGTGGLENAKAKEDIRKGS